MKRTPLARTTPLSRSAPMKRSRSKRARADEFTDADARRWFAAVASLELCVRCGAYGVQVSHRNQGRGLGQKTPPWRTAALCMQCHHAIDNGPDMTQAERRAAMNEAIEETHHRLAARGLLRIAS